jgi:magnesium transporter
MEREPYLGLVIGLAMVVNLAVAGLAGAAIPITMKACGLDPAQSSSIVLTTVTDVVGFFAFLGFAVVFQDLLI